jgi:hypothetical protein
VIGADFDQRPGRQSTVSDQFFGISERDHIVGPAVQNHRVGFHRLGGPPAFPGWTEENEPRLAPVDVHGDGTASARSDDSIRLVLIEFSLGDPGGRLEVIVGQGRVQDLVAVAGQVRWLDAAGYGCQPWRKRIFIAGAGPPWPDRRRVVRRRKLRSDWRRGHGSRPTGAARPPLSEPPGLQGSVRRGNSDAQ